MLTQPWRIEMLGGLKLQQSDQSFTRFRTAKTGALLAYLALFPGRSHSREEISERFWPEADAGDRGKSLRVAREMLVAEEQEELAGRHTDYFVQWVDLARDRLKGPEQALWLDRMETERDNIRAVLDRLPGTEKFALFSGALHQFWYLRGYLREGREWLNAD